jgi:hypothetical protein
MSDISVDSGRADALSRLNGPGLGLIVVGVLSALSSLGGIASSFLGMILGTTGPGFPDLGQFEGTLGGPEQQQLQLLTNAMSGTVGMFSNLLTLVTALVIVAGGVKMRSAEMYSLCVVAAALTLVPCLTPCCCCCVGMPVGIWALIVLLDQHVRSAFTS